MNKNIYLNCRSGLGDRLLDVIGFYVFCKILNYKPHINFNSKQYYCPWGNYDVRLFNFNNEIELFDNNIPKNQTNYSLHPVKPSSSLSPPILYKLLESNDINNLDFKKFSQEYMKYAKEVIKPSNIVESRIPKNIEKAYGIHLRKTDKVNNNGDLFCVNTKDEFTIIISKLMEYIKNIIKYEEEPTFLLVSEEDEWKNKILQMIKHFAGDKNIIFLNINYNDIYLEGFKSVVDMFSLSRCKNILQGVKYSSFSVLAALLGNNNLINFTKYIENKENTQKSMIHLWKSVIKLEELYDNINYEDVNIEIPICVTNIV